MLAPRVCPEDVTSTVSTVVTLPLNREYLLLRGAGRRDPVSLRCRSREPRLLRIILDIP